jgi:hypothetical protein
MSSRMVCRGGGGGGGGDGDGERGRTTLADLGFVRAAFDTGFTDVEGPAEGCFEFDSTLATSGVCSVLIMIGILFGGLGGSTELSLLLTMITSRSFARETESSVLRLEVVEPEMGGGEDGSRPAAGAGDGEDLGDKFSEISLTSDISKSSEIWPDMLSDMFRTI